MAATEHRSYCRICPNACGMIITVDDGRVVRARGDRDHPRTAGYACPKGRALPRWHHHPARLDRPALRREGTLTDDTWTVVLDDLGAALTRIRDAHGPAAVGMYRGMSAYADTLGQPVATRLFAALESPSKYSVWTLDLPCAAYVAKLVTGHPLLWSVPDERARLLLLLGSNPMTSHGHAFSVGVPRTALRAWAGEGEVWVVDPRATATAAAAARHLAPLPGTDYALLAFLVRELLREGADRAYLDELATGVDRLRDAVDPFDLETAAACCDLPPRELVELLEAVRRVGRIAAHTGTGVTMSAAANVATWLVWALNLVTGSHDRPGGNRFDEDAMAGFAVPAVDRREGPRSRPDLPLFTMAEYPCAAMADEIEAGNLRALIVLSGNPLTAIPNPRRLRAALGRLEVLAVADVVRTPTVELATHVMACTGQLERPDLVVGGTIGSAAQYTDAVVAAEHDRRPLWWAFGELGRRLGIDALACRDEPTADALLAATAASHDVDLPALRDRGYATGKPASYGWVRDVLPGGRFQLAPPELVDQLAALPRERPGGRLLLFPRRQRRAFNSVLADGDEEQPELTIHPDDAAACAIADGELVTVSSAHGELRTVAHTDERVRRGAVSLPHGYVDRNVNVLTSERADVDPFTGMVRLTGVPVTVRPAAPPPV